MAECVTVTVCQHVDTRCVGTPFAQSVWEGMMSALHSLDIADGHDQHAPHKSNLEHGYA